MSTTRLASFGTSWDGSAYTEEGAKLKAQFHRTAIAKLRVLARELQLPAGSYDVRSNKGGITVCGEATLHGEHLYVQASVGSIGLRVLARTCDGRRDYSGHVNRWFPLSALDEPEHFAAALRAMVSRKLGTTSGCADIITRPIAFTGDLFD